MNQSQDGTEALPPDEPDRPSAVVFVDLQNFYSFLTSCCGVNPVRIHLMNFVKEWLHHNGLHASEIRIYTGMPDEQLEPQRAEALKRRLAWYHALGAKVFTHKLAYARDKFGDMRGREKGVDVRLASELVEAVAVRGVRRVVVMTQDRDLVQGLDVARNICLMQGQYLHAFSPELKDLSRLQNNERTGNRAAYWGIPLTTKLVVPLDLVDYYTEPAANKGHVATPPIPSNDGPAAETPPTVTQETRRLSPA